MNECCRQAVKERDEVIQGWKNTAEAQKNVMRQQAEENARVRQHLADYDELQAKQTEEITRLTNAVENWKETAQELTEMNARLRAALQRYSVHLVACERHHDMGGQRGPCTCGLDEAQAVQERNAYRQQHLNAMNILTRRSIQQVEEIARLTVLQRKTQEWLEQFQAECSEGTVREARATEEIAEIKADRADILKERQQFLLKTYEQAEENARLNRDIMRHESDRAVREKEIALFRDEVKSLRVENARLKDKWAESNHEIEQVLAQAIGGYPWYKDDQKNFPGATEKDGVCVGDHVPESLASEAAHTITRLRAALQDIHVPHYETCPKPVAVGETCGCWVGEANRRLDDEKREEALRAGEAP